MKRQKETITIEITDNVENASVGVTFSEKVDMKNLTFGQRLAMELMEAVHAAFKNSGANVQRFETEGIVGVENHFGINQDDTVQ